MNLPPFQHLLDAHGPALHRFCVAQVGPDHGSDCFQETILAALRAYPDVRDATNLRGWLFTIAHHKAVDHHRGTSRRAVPVEDAAAGTVDAVPADRELWAAVGRLPGKQRGAVTLRFLADLPYGEIARIIGCTQDAARQSVRAGLAGLRQEVTR